MARCTRLLRLTSFAVLAICSSTAVFAQLEEVVVTARKTAESILDVPFAISAFTAADLNESNIKDFDQLSKFTPGLTFNELNSGAGFNATNRAQNGGYVIRGLNLPTSSGAQAALLFIDGAPFTV